MSANVAVECVGGYRTFTAKQLMSNAALVFVADVADVGRSTVGQHVTFDVLEAYQGVQVGKHTVEFENEFDAFQFEAHQRVLVVAYPTSEPRVRALDGSERYSVSCTRTRPVTLNDPALKEFRRLAERR